LRGDRIPVAFADQQGGFRKRGDLAGVVGVIMADADESNLLGLDVELRQLVDDAHLRRHVGGGHGVTGIPQQVLVAMLDQIAAVDELKFQVAVGIGVREALIDRRRRLRRAAIEPRERHVGRRQRWGLQTECTGAQTGRQQSRNSTHFCCPPWI
jgi:hypothetical protein